MKSLRERIELLISTKGMTNAEFAERIGVQPSNISHVLSGRNNPSLDLVNKILESFREVRTEWLLKGSGSMTGGGYNLFEMEKSDEPKEKPSVPSENVPSVGRPVVMTEKITGSSALKDDEKTVENNEKQEVKEGILNSEIAAEKIIKTAQESPEHKKSKTIEKIVIFYLDNTFKEYYPEN